MMASSSSAPAARHSPPPPEEDFYGGVSGWVEARTTCDHLPTLSNDLFHIPPPDSHCTRCQHPAENWLCLSCKDVLCSRFINKHMFSHHKDTGHCLALSYRSRMNFSSLSSSSSSSWSSSSLMELILVEYLRCHHHDLSSLGQILVDHHHNHPHHHWSSLKQTLVEHHHHHHHHWSSEEQILVEHHNCHHHCGHHWASLELILVEYHRQILAVVLTFIVVVVFQKTNNFIIVVVVISLHYVIFCSDLSVWCFECDAYLDAQVILQLRPVYETAHFMKFGTAPPFLPVEFQVGLQTLQ